MLTINITETLKNVSFIIKNDYSERQKIRKNRYNLFII
jgi:hypothetical protein